MVVNAEKVISLFIGGLILFLLFIASVYTYFHFHLKSVPVSKIYGTYSADYDIAKEKIALNNDGTFRQEVTLKKGLITDVVTGTWKYDHKTNRIIFYNYMDTGFIDGMEKMNANYNTELGIASLPVVTFFGQIRIGSDEGILYKKVKQ